MNTTIEQITTSELIERAFENDQVLINTFGDQSGEFEFQFGGEWFGFTFDFYHAENSKRSFGETSLSVTQVINETSSVFSLGSIYDHEDEEIKLPKAVLSIVADKIESTL